MRKLFSAILSICFLLAVSISSYAQSQGLGQKTRERISKLENICGTWSGTSGDSKVSMSLDMEDSSSAIGELMKDDMVYFLHCFTDDMDKLDAYIVGSGETYEYCILQQNGGETTGLYYLYFEGEALEGLFVSGLDKQNVSLSRVGERTVSSVDLDSIAVEDDRWSNARYLDTREAYESFLEEFPEGKYSDEARDLLDTIDDRHLWEETVKDGSYEAYTAYLDSPVQPKLYEIKAKGMLAYINAVAAENADDPDTVLEFLEEMEKTSGLTEEAVLMRERNLEAQAYKKYMDSSDDAAAILNGIEYVNRFIDGEHRAEVSDRVAYLMASSQVYLTGTSKDVMLTYAVTDDTKEYVNSQADKAARSRYKKSSTVSNLGFNGGIGAAVEATVPGYDIIYGGHLLFSVGDNRNYLNVEFGIRYRYWYFKLLSPERGNVDFHHIRLVVAPKFNVIRQKNSPFYLYIAPEVGYGYPIDMHATGLYMPNSVSFGGRIGAGYGRFDLSAIVTHDFIPMVNENFPAGRYSQTQVGLAFTFYMSGSGRN